MRNFYKNTVERCVITAVGDYIAIVLAEKIVWELTKFVLGENFNLIIPKMYFYIWIPAVFIFFLFYANAHKRMIPYFEVIKNTFLCYILCYCSSDIYFIFNT